MTLPINQRFFKLVQQRDYRLIFHFHCRLVDNETGTDIHNQFAWLKIVGFQRIAGIDQVDDAIGENDQRSELH